MHFRIPSAQWNSRAHEIPQGAPRARGPFQAHLGPWGPFGPIGPPLGPIWAHWASLWALWALGALWALWGFWAHWVLWALWAHEALWALLALLALREPCPVESQFPMSFSHKHMELCPLRQLLSPLGAIGNLS